MTRLPAHRGDTAGRSSGFDPGRSGAVGATAAGATLGAERAEAGVGRRGLAYLVDLGLLGGALVVATSEDRPPLDRALTVGVLGVVVGTVYHVLLEGLLGRTVGKAAVGIAVVREDGGPCTLRAATVRTLGRFVDGLPVAYLVGIASILLTERRQRLGDILASTVVVRTRDGE